MKKNKRIIIITVIIICIIVAIIITMILKNDSQKDLAISNNETTGNMENVQIEDNNDSDSDSNSKCNYIEIEMPNLVGKSYMDIIYNYNLKSDILEQLGQKDLEGTTFDINTLKYLSEGDICINGSYVIEGYGYEVVSQKPEAGSKIKIINDGEGNVSLEEDIYLYIKGGGNTEKYDIDRDKKVDNSNNASQDSNYDDSIYLDDTALIALAFDKWLEQDSYINAQYNNSKYNCHLSGKVTINSDGSVSVNLILYDKEAYDTCIEYHLPLDGVGKYGFTTINLTKEEASK